MEPSLTGIGNMPSTSPVYELRREREWGEGRERGEGGMERQIDRQTDREGDTERERESQTDRQRRVGEKEAAMTWV